MSKADWCNIKVSAPWDGTPFWPEVRDWLQENVDKRDYEIGGHPRYDMSKRVVYFAHEKDAVLFALRWS